MLDWVTLSIEALGIVILCIWVIVPIGEFRSIFRRLRQRQEPVSAEAEGAEDRRKTAD
jgi:hypothetical protein